MSTRCVINFTRGQSIAAKVYRHYDGYPDGAGGVVSSLAKFFSDVEKQTHDTRFNDPSYLAAKFVVWQANEYSQKRDSKTGKLKKGKMLDFLGIGIVMANAGDIEYEYFVDCSRRDAKGWPMVAWTHKRTY